MHSYHMVIIALLLFMTGCVTSPPRQQNDICAIFTEKDDWYDDAKSAEKEWGSPVYITMAFVRQESGFRAKAKPPRGTLLWIFPWFRPSSAYGYPQAKDETWDWYQDKSGNSWADRDDFEDSVEFVAWYNHITTKRNKVKATDAYNLYLAYHEGHQGFTKQTYKGKPWLIQLAKKVASQAHSYQQQLMGCEQRL